MICAVVLAAGRSERMGTQKLLLPWRGQPLVCHVVDELIGSPLQRIIVVVGRDAEQIQRAWSEPVERGVHAASRHETERATKFSTTVPGPATVKRAEARAPAALQSHLTVRVTFVHNPDADGDMLSSVRCGLRALPESCEALLVVLGDQPGVSREVVRELIHALNEQRSAAGVRRREIIVPSHSGRRGHPLLFAARFRDEILARHDGVGLHGLLAAHPEEVLEVEVSTAAELEDMDTPEDYQRHLGSLQSYDRT